MDIQVTWEDAKKTDLVVETSDTMRHEALLKGYIETNTPFLLCGPPGSGKTMTLLSTLRKLGNYDFVMINFNSDIRPGHIYKALKPYVDRKSSSRGITMEPKDSKDLIVFCDEINLPAPDKYDTTTVIMLMRQIWEYGYFWDAKEQQKVFFDRIQFVGACNPPGDAGRHPLSERFMRRCAIVLIDFPSRESMVRI